MRTQQILMLILALSLTRTTARAADSGPIVSPQQIVSEALAHSHKLQSAGIESQLMQARKNQAVSRSLPSLKIAASANSYNGLQDSAMGSFVFPAIEDRYSLQAELSQTVFTAGRISGARKAADFDRRAAESALRSTDADLRLQALTAYWSWSKAHFALAATQAAVKRVESHNRDVKNQKDSGMATESDALSAEVLMDQTILRKQDAQRNLDLARATTAFMVGRELAADAIPQKPNAATLSAIQAVKEVPAIEAAMTNRPERLRAEMAVRSAHEQVVVNRSAYYPQLSLVARYEQARPNNLFFPPVDEWNDDTFVGAVAAWNLFEGGLTRAKVVEAASREKQARLQAEEVTEAIALEVKQARIRLDAAIARLAVSQRAEKSAERNLEVTRNQWISGTTRHSDVLDAESKYADAQYESVVSAGDAVLAKASMDHAMGVLGK